MSPDNLFTHPYRASWTHRSHYGYGGWSSSQKFFATFEEAVEAIKAKFPAGVTDASVYVAFGVDAAPGIPGWAWAKGKTGYRKLAFRNRKQELVVLKQNETAL